MSTETETVVKEKISVQISPPSFYKVIFLNDDATPMEHVIELLVNIFGHDQLSATDVTLEIHNTGSGVAGIYAFEIAEQKALEATEKSRANNYPLRIRVEREE
jgi:ATP-dependent Clp protease adaptor protein ClpS